MIDGPQNDEQYMRELYERFLKGVRENNNSEFYEEDELLDIYDFAQDEGNEMVQLYVLLTGARLYPDSDFLDERKAFFLSSINNEAARNMLKRKGRRDSALWEVLKLSLDTYPDGNPEEGLTELLASEHRLSCETVIRLFDMLHDLGREDLIAENLHMLQEKAENKTIFCYEAAEALYHNEKYLPMARDIADDLTQQEPFNPDNWNLLAKIELALQHVDESVAAIDYALAIDPDNQNALLMKGLSLLASNKNNEKAVETLRKVLSINPDNSLAMKALADVYVRSGKSKAAIEVYSMYLQRNSSDVYVILDILKLHPENADGYFDMLANEFGNNERKWIEIAAQLVNDNEVAEAARVLTYYNVKYSLCEGMEYYLQLLYRLRMFKEYVCLFGDCCGEASKPGGRAYNFTANAYLLLSSSYLLNGMYDDAVKMCDVMLNDPPTANDFDEQMRWKGMQLTLTFIRNLAKDPDLIPKKDAFDPITFRIPIS